MRALLLKSYLNGPSKGKRSYTVCDSSQLGRLVADEMMANPCSKIIKQTPRYAHMRVDTTRQCFAAE